MLLTVLFPKHFLNLAQRNLSELFNILQAVKDNITVLTLQENVRAISTLTLTDNSGRPVLLNESLSLERVREFHFLKVYLRDGVTLINNEIYRLTIVYIGNINETPLSRGVFRGSYRDSENKLQ